MILEIGAFRFPICDDCGMPLKLYREDGFYDGEENEWESAPLHRCSICDQQYFDACWQEADPCGNCRTQPCERGGDCWWNPPLHLFPYLHYVAEPAIMIDLLPQREHINDEPERMPARDCDLCDFKYDVLSLRERLEEHKRHLELVGTNLQFLNGFQEAMEELSSVLPVPSVAGK